MPGTIYLHLTERGEIMVLTEKESTAIKDLQTQEQSCIEKYQRYATEAKDQVLVQLFQELQKKEQQALRFTWTGIKW